MGVFAMGESTAIVRFADVIVDPATQHAWVLRSNLTTLDMECECLRCGRIETLTTIDSWNKGVKAGVGWAIVHHRAAWKTVTEECQRPDAPVVTEGLVRGPVIAVHPLEE
jgi:hypothetical protein